MDGQRQLLLLWKGQHVLFFLKDFEHSPAAGEAVTQCSLAGTVKALCPEGRFQPQQTKSTSIALLRMLTPPKDVLNHSQDKGTDLAAPGLESFRSPTSSFLMGLGHMLRIGGVLVHSVAASMGCDTCPLMENFYNSLGTACFYIFPGKRIQNGVEVLFHLNMIIQIDLGLFPVSHFIRNFR